MLLCVALATLSAGIGGLYAAFAVTAPNTTSPTGVTLGQVDVGGFNADQLATTAAALTSQAQLAITHGDRTAAARLSDLGVTVDTAATVRTALDVGTNDSLLNNRSAPVNFNVALELELDDTIAQQWLMRQFRPDLTEPVNAQVVYDDASGHFTVIPGQAGWAFDLEPVRQALDRLAARPNQPTSCEINPVVATPVISQAAAEKAADQANARLALDLQLVTEAGTAHRLTAAEVAPWTSIKPNLATAEVTVSYDPVALRESLAAVASEAFDQVGQARLSVFDADGQLLATPVGGQSGIAVGDLTATARDLANALTAGHDGFITVPTKMTEPPELRTTLSGPAPVAGKWIDVDLTNQMTTLLVGDSVVTSYQMSSGLRETPTPPGTYRVYSHVPVQNMTGVNADGSPYFVPDVPWATWFWNDYGFHAAYWLDESQIGRPQSHGCVNLRLADADYLYHWADDGTTVVVHGQEPV
jgi:hypothetical protein